MPNVRHWFMLQASADGAGLTENGQRMWMSLLEAGVAVGLLLFIVWWTWPRPGNKDDGEPK